MRKFSIEGYPLSMQPSDTVVQKKDAMRAFAHQFLLSVLEALAKRFRDQPEATEIARLHQELSCMEPTTEALEQATRYCTSDRCRGLTIE
jgi:hypothetical protein